MPNGPLISGSRILNARTGSPGTLGFIGVGPQGDHFLVSCYHVLGRLGEPPGDGEAIWHTAALASQMIALTEVDRMNPWFDIAAAPLFPGIPVAGEILSLGPIKGIAAATEGMRVVKFGAETGLTEGVISYVGDRHIEIDAVPGADVERRLSERGDSGALWVTPDGEAVAMHFRGRDGNQAFARPMPFVLWTLGLTLLTGDR